MSKYPQTQMHLLHSKHIQIVQIIHPVNRTIKEYTAAATIYNIIDGKKTPYILQYVLIKT